MKTSKELKSTLFFLRHGKTKYTQEFPDLTPDGKQEAKEIAEAIYSFIRPGLSVNFVSSPLPRALGTASIILNRFGHHFEDIKIEDALRCMDFYRPNEVGELWAGFSSLKDVDCAYINDSQFEEGVIVEKRSDIQHRFFRYLSGMFDNFMIGKLEGVTIHTTHYEVLWKIVSVFELKEPLTHCELIRIDFSRTEGEPYGLFTISFRGFSKSFTSFPSSHLFMKQFSL